MPGDNKKYMSVECVQVCFRAWVPGVPEMGISRVGVYSESASLLQKLAGNVQVF